MKTLCPAVLVNTASTTKGSLVFQTVCLNLNESLNGYVVCPKKELISSAVMGLQGFGCGQGEGLTSWAKEVGVIKNSVKVHRRNGSVTLFIAESSLWNEPPNVALKRLAHATTNKDHSLPSPLQARVMFCVRNIQLQLA